MLRDENAKPTDLPITVLKAITKDFSEDLEIGNGGFAVVYKGLLGNGRTVAVKKLFKSIDMDENKYNQEPQSSTGSGRVKEEVSKNGDYCSPFELQATGRDKVKLETIPRINSILQTTSCTDFAVLVRVTAPRRCSERSRLGVDLVAVLDVARSFRLFSTMDSIKEAMVFVINNLGPDDRLSIVTFNDQVRRCTELSEMSDVNREEARAKVLALKAGLGTDMGAAMQEAAKWYMVSRTTNRLFLRVI
ncbi:hypothetical protein BAE44_0017825 [Dichanthelium oligosanthes]|uniref:VWFA domain-containing protein n=1 Tax=Dichanthelium oligosanthes TaxID=888268 RepID=A0A1E5V802_9POAL|nr:hypothetical protein BAE44_0017825 [Dichanthelium oligosanthes]